MNAPWSIALAYAVGCVSFAVLVARIRGVDIRSVGSGNPGATNVGRALGKPWGMAVLALDVAKGFLPVALLTAPVSQLGLGTESSWVPTWVDSEGRVLILAAAVLGHVYPVTTGFKGGKGVATLIGGAAAYDPLLALFAVLTHLVLKKFLGFVSIASVALGWALPVGQVLASAVGVEGVELGGRGVLALLALLITLRHLDNFRRIRAGTEDRYDGPDLPGDGAGGQAGD